MSNVSMSKRLILLLCLAALIQYASPIAQGAEQSKPQTAPEVFTSHLEAQTARASAATSLRVQLDRYTTELTRKQMTDALMHGGYGNFLAALRKAPIVGVVEV